MNYNNDLMCKVYDKLMNENEELMNINDDNWKYKDFENKLIKYHQKL